MSNISKKRKEIISKIDQNKIYKLDEAINLIKETSKANFNETVDLAVNVALNIEKSDQSIKGAVSLPHGSGKSLRVAVIAKGNKAEDAKKFGADIVGDNDLIKKIENGEINFDRLIAVPEMMREVGKLGRVLGPKGLMPNPKLGTVTNEIAKTVEEVKKGQIQFKNDKNGIVHAGVGKVSFEKNHLIENIKVFFEAILKNKPDSIKGTYIKRVSIASTMGLGIRLNVGDLNKS